MSLAFDLRRTFGGDGVDPFTVEASLTVDDGETLVLLGPSGSGKTLLLETVAGFHGTDGRVGIDGRDVSDGPPEERDLGLVAQEYALFPHLTVRENVAFGAPYHERLRDPDRLLADLGIGDLADRSPGTLSGGERGRVALARALAVRPSALLLDEPLSALDAPTRRRLRADLAELLADRTVLCVTHDRTTARGLADRVAVIGDGTVRQVGPTDAVFERPESAFVARFTGANCVLVAGLPRELRTGLDASADAEVAIRPEHVVLDPPDPDATAAVLGVVREETAFRVRLGVGDVTLAAYADRRPAVGSEVGIGLPDDRIHPLGSC